MDPLSGTRIACVIEALTTKVKWILFCVKRIIIPQGKWLHQEENKNRVRWVDLILQNSQSC